MSQEKIVLVNFTCALFPHLFTHDSLAMQAFVWLCTVQFGTVWFDVSYANLRQPHTFKHQIYGKGLAFE